MEGIAHGLGIDAGEGELVATVAGVDCIFGQSGGHTVELDDHVGIGESGRQCGSDVHDDVNSQSGRCGVESELLAVG